MSAKVTTGWTRFDYEHGETIWQRECPDCDRGLLLAPARFCGRCGGTGFLVRASNGQEQDASADKASEDK